MIKAPFPYFGGKRRVAPLIWKALGQPQHYIEPFFGSGAVLLARPNYNAATMTETINDADGFICNVWRALQAAPDEVAKVCDWPVNHADLISRRARLIREENYLLENLCRDDTWFDVKLAGYWIWAASCWIGSGLTIPNAIPHISDGGKGVHTKGQIPHISHGGKGVHTKGQIPHISHRGKGVQDPYNNNLFTWFRALSNRLRHVRVICGDWKRVCGGAWQTRMGICGVFFDPPYGVDHREDVYHKESRAVSAEVRAWCFERGALPDYRIVLAGYFEEHAALLKHGWTARQWVANGGYAHTSTKQTRGDENRKKEAEANQ